MSLVSLIITTHNRPQLLPHAVQSARAAGADVEVIVVDDASTDRTAVVCRELTGIRYIRLERNQGTAGARNVGILASSGKYISFLDDDDRRLPDSLEIQLQALEAHPEAGFVCGAMIMANQNYEHTGEIALPRQTSGDVFWALLELDFPVMPLSTLIRKECFFRVGLFNHRLVGIDDWDLFVRVAELYHVLIITQPVGVYRQPTPFSGQGSSARAAQLRRVARHQLRLLQLPRVAALKPSERRAIRRRTINRIADTLLWNAAQHLSDLHFGAACANTVAAMRMNSFRLARPAAYRKLVSHLSGKNANH